MRVFPLLLAVLLNTVAGQAQQAAGDTGAEKQIMEALLQRIGRLESEDKELRERVTQLEKAQHELAAESTSSSPVHPEISPETTVGQESETAPDRADSNKTLLNIRGFGDYSFHGSNQKGTPSAFSLGQMDFFISSNISDRFRLVTDLVFEKGVGNDFDEELERFLFEYRYNNYFKLAVGRDQTALGYYNLAFRHSSWFQTPTGRPFLFAFEDEGGILPGHIVGASASGQIPSGFLGLHYIAEVGNGRSATPGAEPVQNFADENTHKAVDLNIVSRPDAAQGLQVGFSVYHDILSPPNSVKIAETDLNTYVVLDRSRFEWLNEGLLIRHTPHGLSHTFNTEGFYTQLSEKFGSFTPYFRYQYVNAPSDEPIFFPVYNVSVGLQEGPSVGVRYDFAESVAIKLQYDYNYLRRQQTISQDSINQLALQFSFAF
jgi:hypothetical protein